jgi:hypothetical protein
MIEDCHEKSFKQSLDAFQKDLWAHPEQLSLLEPSKAMEALTYAVDLACSSQNSHNIHLGRQFVTAAPRDWVLKHIEQVAEPLVQLNDDWEYRRLLELYEDLDDGLLLRLAKRGLQSSNPEIRDAANDFIERRQTRDSAEER